MVEHSVRTVGARSQQFLSRDIETSGEAALRRNGDAEGLLA